VGLDLYAGTLTRYYSGHWETIVQKDGRATGEPTLVVRPPGSWIDIDPARTRGRVLEWRSRVSSDLAAVAALPEPLDWPEDMEQPYFTDKPDWPCFGAMVLLAAYTEAGELPPAQLPEAWEQDPTLRRLEAATNSGAEVRYPHLYFVEWWLPVADLAIFNTPSPIKKPIRVGSLHHLIHHLHDLNRRTFQSRAHELEPFRVDVPSPDDHSLEALASAGLAITLHVAANALRHRLPMLLDY
jgi:hypothetical protein